MSEPQPPTSLRAIVYALTNAAMPGIVKIGHTTCLAVRMDQLFSTSAPLPFDCVYAVEVGDEHQAQELEAALHGAFAPYRVHPQREFFRIDPAQCIPIMAYAGRDATPDVPKQEHDGRAQLKLAPVTACSGGQVRRAAQLTDAIRERAPLLAEEGLSNSVIAVRLGVNRKRFTKWLREDADFHMAMETARAKRAALREQVAAEVYTQGMGHEAMKQAVDGAMAQGAGA